MSRLYLHEVHQRAGAKFIHVQDQDIPADYGNVKDELDAINHRVGLLDRSYLGKIFLKGPDALDLLDRISTNDLHYLAVGTVTDTVFTTPKGRLIDYCRVINAGDGLVLIGSFFHAGHLIDWINRFIILEDVQVSDVSRDYLWFTLIGPRSRQILTGMSHNPVSDTEEAIWLNIWGENIPALKNNNFKVPAFNLCIGKKNAFEIMDTLSSALADFQGVLIGDTAFQIIRVESGMPDWGTEITQDYNPHEARLTNAISFTKGCYTGQEVIARLDTYDKVQKYLMIIELSQKISTQPPADLFIEEELIGQITSYIYDPVYNRSVGLGCVKKMYAFEDDIYVEVQSEKKRIPARLRLPPQAYREK